MSTIKRSRRESQGTSGSATSTKKAKKIKGTTNNDAATKDYGNDDNVIQESSFRPLGTQGSSKKPNETLGLLQSTCKVEFVIQDKNSSFLLQDDNDNELKQLEEILIQIVSKRGKEKTC